MRAVPDGILPPRPPPRPRRPRPAAALPVLVLALAGCLRDPIEVLQRGGGVAMVGIVSADTDTISVLLGGVGSREHPESGATLMIEGPHGRVDLAESPVESCGLVGAWACYRAAYPAAPRPGERYRIEGELVDGTPLSGVTIVPARPTLVLRDGATAGSLVADTLRVAEMRSPFMELKDPLSGGWVSIIGGELPAEVWTPGGRRSCVTVVFEISADLRFSSFAIPIGEPRCGQEPLVWDSMAVEARVAAFDSSFTSYWEQTSGVTQALFPHQAAWGVEGVLGVFGSSAPRRLVVVVTNPKAAAPSGSAGAPGS